MGYRLVGVLLFGALAAGCSYDSWPATGEQSTQSLSVEFIEARLCDSIQVRPHRIGDKIMVRIGGARGWADERAVRQIKEGCK